MGIWVDEDRPLYMLMATQISSDTHHMLFHADCKTPSPLNILQSDAERQLERICTNRISLLVGPVHQ